MRQLTALLTIATAVGMTPGASTLAVAQAKDPVAIADSDSVFIDGRAFKLVPGKAKGDASAQIKALGARDLGPGAIVFRAGDKLYIAEAAPALQSMSDRYGSDRDTSVSAAQAERDWRDWQQFTRQNPRYGSDRDTSVSTAQAERDWQDFQRQNSRYGSDRYGSDRYGSDRDTSVSAAQAERDWRDWQQFTRQNPRYGSDRDTSVSAKQAERDWQDFLRQNSRYGSDRYGSDRYGSDRDTSVSAAQAERDWRDWQQFTRQNPRYGSDRDTSVSATQAERDWQDFLRQNARYGSDRYGSDRYGSDRYGSDRYGSDRYGSDRYGSDADPQRVYVNDPDYVQYKLKKAFEENWTASAAR